jgi:alkylation response protein AidB-like acyl-CoA dehydrogenase
VTILETAQQLAREVLFPAAIDTDRAAVLPVALLDALADAGLYGLTGPATAGGVGADFATVCAVVEALSSGCLTTAFVWVQHQAALNAAAASENPAIEDLVAPLCSGVRRAGLTLGGAVPGPPSLRARQAGDG